MPCFDLRRHGIHKKGGHLVHVSFVVVVVVVVVCLLHTCSCQKRSKLSTVKFTAALEFYFICQPRVFGILTRSFAAVDVELSSLWLPTGIRHLALMRSFLNQLQILGLQKAGGSSEGFTSLTVKYLFCVYGE